MKVLIDDKLQEYTSEQISQWMAELPQWRREKVEVIKHESGRRQSLLAYRLLCRGLREEYGITEPPTFAYGEHGKPYIKIKNEKIKMKNETGPYFSLSHCREAVACIIDEHPCGIDIESVGRKISNSLIRYAMNDEEQVAISQAKDSIRTFLRLWTQKEAVLKLIGTGIRNTMKEVLVNCPYHIETRETNRYIISTATTAAPLTVSSSNKQSR